MSKQQVASPPAASIQWPKKPKQFETDLSFVRAWKSDCGRIEVRHYKSKLAGGGERWQVWGPRWSGHTRITAKLWEGKKQKLAFAAAESALAKYITEGNAE